MINYFRKTFNVPTKRYKEEQPWLPLSNVMQNWDIKFHRLMLADRIRMTNYRKAIDETLCKLHSEFKNEKIIRIMDIGTGTGVLSAWVAHGWTQLCSQHTTTCCLEIYAIEYNANLANIAERRLKEFNNSSVKIRVINKSSYDLDLTDLEIENYDCMDLIIAELLGNLGDNEDMVAILSHAKAKFLKENGQMIPQKVEQYFVPISSEILFKKIKSGSDDDIATLSPDYKDLLDSKMTQKYCDVVIPSSAHLSSLPKKPAIVWDFNKEITLEIEYAKKISYPISRDDDFHGIKCFFKAYLTNSVILNLSPDDEFNIPTSDTDDNNLRKKDYAGRNVSDCWKHGFLCIDKQIPVKIGDIVILTYKRKLVKNQQRFFYEWKASLKRSGKLINSFTSEKIEFDRPHVHHAGSQKLDDDIQRLELISHEYNYKGEFLMDEEIAVEQIMSFFNPSNDNLKLNYTDSKNKEEIRRLSDKRLKNENLCIGFPSSSSDLLKKKFTWVNFKGKMIEHESKRNDWIIYYRLVDSSKEIPSSEFMKVDLVKYEDFEKDILKHIGTEYDKMYFLTMLVIPAHIFPQFSPSEIFDLKTAYLMLEERIIIEILEKGIIKHGTRAAVAAIMGRNMSHNIGSHVLSYWNRKLEKCEVEYSPDKKPVNKTFGSAQCDVVLRDLCSRDRLFFDYLRSRMDFIAEISTTDPAWTSTMMFCQDILYPFLAQRVLLNYLVMSEGAHLESCLELGCGDKDSQHHTLYFEINRNQRFLFGFRSHPNQRGLFYKSDMQGTWTKNKNRMIKLKYDIPVSIPHGVTGVHAFYSILENFIRNGAKHSKKILGESDYYKVIINIEDSGVDLLKINISDNRGSCNKEVIKRLNDGLSEKLVNTKGIINHGNWGLKEQKISACFLRMGGSEHVDKTVEYPPIWSADSRDKEYLKPSCIECKDEVMCDTPNVRYDFYLLKPKEALLVGADESNEAVGIFKIEKDNFDKEYIREGVPHRFLITQGNDCDEQITKYSEYLPQRLLSYDAIKIENNTKDILSFYKAWLDKAYQKANILYRCDSAPRQELNFTNDICSYEEKAQTNLDEATKRNIIVLDDHGKMKRACNNVYERFLYYQDVSGANPTKMLLLNLEYLEEDQRVLTLLELMEAALTKVLIADERVWEANSDGAHLADLKGMNIALVCLKNKRVDISDIRQSMAQFKPHFFVIHQGLLDKLGNNEEGLVRDETIKSNAFFVISSGRGLPNSLMTGARFLEISALERFVNERDKYGLVQVLYSLRRYKNE